MSRSVPVDKETRTYPFSRFTTLLYQVHRANKNLAIHHPFVASASCQQELGENLAIHHPFVAIVTLPPPFCRVLCEGRVSQSAQSGNISFFIACNYTTFTSLPSTFTPTSIAYPIFTSLYYAFIPITYLYHFTIDTFIF